jgi:parvulin-like peptidyl-prolyl isomerase
MNKEVIYQLILLRKIENASQKQLDSLKEKALAIKSEIDHGKNFDSLVIKYSQDIQSLRNNGYPPPVGWKESILTPVGNIIFRLNQNDVRVLNDNDAFRIIRITEINKIPVESFDKIKNEIISNLRNIYYQTSIDEYEKDKKELIDESSLRWNENVLKQLVKLSNELNFYKEKYEETFEGLLASGNNQTILVYDKAKVDYEEYLRLLNNILILPSAKNNITENDLKEFILEAIRTDLIVKKANSLDLKKNIFNPFTKNLTLKNQLAYLYSQAEIEAKIPETTDEALQQFFKENENTLYYQLEKRNIFVMVFSNKDDAENASRKIKQRIPFEKVKGSYLVKTYIKERNGEIKSYLNDEKPVFAKVAYAMKESEVSNPIQFENDTQQIGYAIIKCYHIRPEKQLTFDDVKNSIVEDFKNYHRKKLEKDVEERLKNKYNPVINEEVLAKIISPN